MRSSCTVATEQSLAADGVTKRGFVHNLLLRLGADRAPQLKEIVRSQRLSRVMNTSNQLLKRYWFMIPGHPGFGVTAFSLEDAHFLLEAEGVLMDPNADVIVDVDVSSLDAGHVLPNAGPSCFRGVWFPCLNIGWVEPGAHHPHNGGKIKAAPPFVCGIRVCTNTDSTNL